jgi:hypothetical protein
VQAGSARGLLIFGASKFSRELAKVLKGKDIKVILADSNWDNIRLARMDNIPVYFGNPASEHADTYLDLTGIGKVLILSPYRQLNPLVYFHFQDILGQKKVYGLSNTESNGTSARHQLSESYLKRMCLFGETVSYAKLASLMSKGGVLKSTNLTESFGYKDFYRRYGETVVPLMYLKNGKVTMLTGNTTDLPTGIELISLIPKEAMAEASALKEALKQARAEAEQKAKELEAKEQQAVLTASDEQDKKGNEDGKAGGTDNKQGRGEVSV